VAHDHKDIVALILFPSAPLEEKMTPMRRTVLLQATDARERHADFAEWRWYGQLVSVGTDATRLLYRRAKYYVLAILLAACGEAEPENLAPKVCGPIGDQEAFIGAITEVEACFTDPDGDTLEVSAESADPAIVLVLRVREQVVDLSAEQVGSTTVTVTAEDSGALMAEHAFRVTVPNRPPEATEPLPGFELIEGTTELYGLAGRFRDPDGHELTYTASSSDSAIVLPFIVARDSLMVATLRIGKALVTVEASDGHDAVSQEADAVVIEDPDTAGYLFSHDFADRNRGLRYWESQVYATLTVSGGKLHVSNDSIYRGWAYRDLGFDPWEEPPARVEYTAMAEYEPGGGVELVIHMRKVGMEYVSIGLGDSIPFDAGGVEEADTVYVDYGFAGRCLACGRCPDPIGKPRTTGRGSRRSSGEGDSGMSCRGSRWMKPEGMDSLTLDPWSGRGSLWSGRRCTRFRLGDEVTDLQECPQSAPELHHRLVGALAARLRSALRLP